MKRDTTPEGEAIAGAVSAVEDPLCFHCWLKAAGEAYLRSRSGGELGFSECGSEESMRKGVAGISKLLAEFVCDNVVARDREGALVDAARWSREYLAGAEKEAAGKLS